MKLGTESRGKTITAIALCVLAALILVWQLMPSSPVAEVAGAGGPGQEAALQQGNVPARRTTKKGAEGALAQTLDPRLKLGLLEAAESTKYQGKGRNIFRAEAEPEIKIEKPIQTPVVQNPGPPQPPPPPPINLKFFGFANRTGEARQVFLSSQNGDIFVAKEGDIVNRRYRIVRINPTSVEVEDVLSNNRQSIPLQAG